MKFAPLHASLMTLALFAIAGPGVANAAGTEPAFTLAQAETDAPAVEPPAPEPGQPQPQDQAEQPPAPQPEPQPEVQPEPPQQSVQPEPAPEPEPQPEPEPEPQQAAPEAPEPQPEVKQDVQQEPAPEAEQQESDEVAQFLQSVRPASDLSEDELRRQISRATELSKSGGMSEDQRRALRDVIRDARAELRRKSGNDAAGIETPPQAQPPAEPQPPAAEQPQQQAQAPQVTVDPALERQARVLLEDDVNVREMDRRELRQRLSGMRDLLASDKLSPETREALRSKLAAERQILRSEVSSSEGGNAQPPAQATGGTTVNNNVIVNNTTVNNTTITNTDIQVALRDRRPARELDDDELVRRIDIYRDVVRDERYDAEEREAWRRALERDRRYLRRQMLEEREARAERLRRGGFEFEVVIGNDYDPDDAFRDDVFAAEVDDEELERVIVAPPRRKLERRYTVEEIERSPEARDAVARIEIDTVNFGFGEGFLREEEIDKLDRIAEVLEKVLAKNPGEVFLLEGHTDAVGSSAANLALSRQRAAAVKEALTTYYVIPAGNLRTVGLGERYLKIPTQQAEAENRRVSLARITALVGQAD